MVSKYWVQYRYENPNTPWDKAIWHTTSCFVTTGDGCKYNDLEDWWQHKVVYGRERELLQVVKL